jgi:hypothetical protein
VDFEFGHANSGWYYQIPGPVSQFSRIHIRCGRVTKPSVSPPVPGGKLRVFISWPLPFAGEVAMLLRDWLRRVIQDVDPWVSMKDIENGKFWHRS